MSNLPIAATVSLSDRVTIPASLPRAEVAALASKLFGNVAGAFEAVDKTAKRDAFVMRCASLAISAMYNGDSSRLSRLEAYAVTLPSYKKNKGGEITGALGKLIVAYREAVSIGNACRTNPLFDGKGDTFNLSFLAESPIFAGIIAPLAEKVAIAAPSNMAKRAAPIAAADPVAAPVVDLSAAAIAAVKRNEENHGALWAAYGDNLAAGMKAAKAYDALPTMLELFSKLNKDNAEQAIEMLRGMAAIAGFSLIAEPIASTAHPDVQIAALLAEVRAADEPAKPAKRAAKRKAA